MKRPDVLTFYANKGIARNKRPLSNILIKLKVTEIAPEDQESLSDAMKEKLFKGQLIELFWNYQKNISAGTKSMAWAGTVHPDKLKALLSAKQWGKFCQGERDFIVQRRVDGKNIPLQTKNQ